MCVYLQYNSRKCYDDCIIIEREARDSPPWRCQPGQHNNVEHSTHMGFPQGDKRTADKARRPSNGVKISSELIAEALRKSRGNIARAADKIGVTRSCLHLRINKESELKAIVDECRERFLDDTEDVFQNKVLSGDTISMLFALKTLGKRRGYDQDRDVIAESVTRAALDFVMNKSKNPAE